MYEIQPIQCLAGVQPSTDRSSFATPHYVFADKVRFINGFPEKIGGWTLFTIDNNDPIMGCPRTYFSFILNDRIQAIIGTSSHLYSLIASQLVNITPLDTTAIPIANSLATYYKTLANNPITTVISSNTVTIADSSTKVRVGDTITLSGVPGGGVNGIPAGDLNTSHFVRTQATNSFTITVSSSATSSGAGGGASVVLATGIITVTQASHGFDDGDRIEITGAADTGGILAAEINTQFQIRNVTSSTYDISTEGTATSSVTGGGGASTEVYGQIASGSCDAFPGQGYGMGRYGTGLYGVSKLSTSVTLPRIWSLDRFGDLVIMTPGNGGKFYSWNGSTLTAPSVVTNAPTENNYVFTTNNIAVSLGADGVANRVKWSDQGNLTTWTATAVNLAGEDDIEGTPRLLSQCNVRGVNLLFTANQTYTMAYVGGQFVFNFQVLSPTVGIISQNARVVYEGVAYWMANDNFYMYSGGNVEIIPANSQDFCTLLNYVFDDLNTSQQSKIFAWVNEQFREVWWHYPSTNSNDPDRVVRYNVQERTWTMDTMERTAAEYPDILLVFPRLMNLTGDVFKHEDGYNDNEEPLAWQLTTKYFGSGTNTIKMSGIIPDSTQTGDISMSIYSKLYPQRTDIVTKGPYLISPDTGRVGNINFRARNWQFDLSGEELDQQWRSGQWQQEVKVSTRR